MSYLIRNVDDKTTIFMDYLVNNVDGKTPRLGWIYYWSMAKENHKENFEMFLQNSLTPCPERKTFKSINVSVISFFNFS